MSINTSIGLVGAALQADKHTPAAAPAYTHGLTGGKVFTLDRSIESASVSCGVRAGTDSYVSAISSGLDFDTYGYADVLPLYLYGAMGGIASRASETDGLYEHTATLGDVIPYLTFWGRIGGEYTRTEGCKIDQLEMEFEGNKPVSFGLTVLGMAAFLGLDGIPEAGDPSCFDGYFVPTGGEFKLDTASDTPLEAPVLSGSLSLANACSTSALAGQVLPGSVDEGKLTSSGKVKVKPDDLTPYRRMVCGSDTGTTPTGDMVYGSFEWRFRHSKDPRLSMTVKAARVPFTAEFPEVNPDGGAAEMEFSFADIGIDSRGGSPVEITVTNATEKYL